MLSHFSLPITQIRPQLLPPTHRRRRPRHQRRGNVSKQLERNEHHQSRCRSWSSWSVSSSRGTKRSDKHLGLKYTYAALLNPTSDSAAAAAAGATSARLMMCLGWQWSSPSLVDSSTIETILMARGSHKLNQIAAAVGKNITKSLWAHHHSQ